MSAKGNVRQETESTDWERHTGFVEIRKIVAFNPTIEEKNKIYGKDNSDSDEDIVYLSETENGDKRVRLDFYYETHKPEIGIKRHSITLTNKERLKQDKTKVQVVNQVGNCSWVMLDENGNPDFSTLLDWFTHFLDDKNTIIGDRSVRTALEGEELLMTFLRALININYSELGAELSYDYKKLFKGDFKELRGDVMNTEMTHPFTGLLNVETSEDGEKQYEKLYPKMFLPSGIMKNINLGGKFSGEWYKKLWKKFLTEIQGEHGVKGFYKLKEVSVYDKEEDVAAQKGTKKEAEPTSSEY